MYTHNQTDNNINNMPVGLPFGGEVAAGAGWPAQSASQPTSAASQPTGRQASSRRTESLLMMWDKSSISKHQTMADTNRVGQTIHLSNCHRRDWLSLVGKLLTFNVDDDISS